MLFLPVCRRSPRKAFFGRSGLASKDGPLRGLWDTAMVGLWSS